MKLRNRILAFVIIGLSLVLANPLAAMKNENKHLKRLQMIVNHINPPAPQNAELFDARNLEEHNSHVFENVKKSQEEYLKACRKSLLVDCLISIGVATIPRLNGPGIIQRPDSNFLGALLYAAIKGCLLGLKDGKNSFMDNYIVTFLENKQSELKTEIIKKLMNNPYAFNEFKKNLLNSKEFKYAIGCGVLSSLHWSPRERASLKTFLACLGGTGLFLYTAYHKAENKLYKKANLLPTKELSRMQHLLNHLQQI